ncbi:cysteine desulfurase family protein [Microbacterium amylolyticum]|uniref:Cysteine desulfurase n=1 Tax=Microbacterium amylolyticum TaxID=936337 RepID=A0ABS4ZKB0_9MICO|nr:cysteine desulfurase family protein [Microbacterium amylolyticum]MBP2437724.1 cysteine desulfurase [Microbacterium amylolyticum]
MLYLDNAATAPVRREVLEAMTPFLTSEFGNPSSSHQIGERAAAALADARRRVAHVLGVRTNDVIFTSGGTEANNLGIKGIAIAAGLESGARHIITAPIEHSSVLASVDYLSRVHGAEVTFLPVDLNGRIDETSLASALRDDTAVVAIGHANNEVGTVQPIAEIWEICRKARVPLHIDAVQGIGWCPVPRGDAIAVSGHKIGAPKGTGAVAIRAGIPLEPLLHGGGQERGRRSGTESVAGAVGLATALELAETERAEAAPRLSAIRDRFITDVLRQVPGARLTGHPRDRLPHVASFTIDGVNGETLLLDLEQRGITASSGSACSARNTEPSHVLLALGMDESTARTALRFSLPRTLRADLTPVATALSEAVSSHRL